MSNLEPSGPAQPTLDQVYEAPGNQADKEPAQEAATSANAQAPRGQEQRVPSQQSSGIEDATGSSLGRGIHGAPPGEEVNGETNSQDIQARELDGQQMGASGEGAVRDVVDKKPGATGGQDDMASDLDRYVSPLFEGGLEPSAEGMVKTNKPIERRRSRHQCERPNRTREKRTLMLGAYWDNAVVQLTQWIRTTIPISMYMKGRCVGNMAASQ